MPNGFGFCDEKRAAACAAALRFGLALFRRKSIFFPEGGVIGIKGCAVFADTLQYLVAVEIMVDALYDAAGDIGAMIADPFKVGKKVGPDKARFDTAGSLLHPADMTGA